MYVLTIFAVVIAELLAADHGVLNGMGQVHTGSFDTVILNAGSSYSVEVSVRWAVADGSQDLTCHGSKPVGMIVLTNP